MEILIKIIFGANLFISGYFLADQLHWTNTKKERVIVYAQTILGFFIAVFFIIGVFAWALLERALKPLHIRDWFFLFFTKKFNNLDGDSLRRLNQSIEHTTLNNLKFRIMKLIVSIINKRNNYIHEQQNSN